MWRGRSRRSRSARSGLLLFVLAACGRHAAAPDAASAPAPKTSLVISRDQAIDQSTPAAAQAILATGDLVVVASSRIGFAAVDARTLALRWRRTLAPAGPAVDLGDGRLALPGPGGAEIVRAGDGGGLAREASPLGGGTAWPTGDGCIAWARGGTVVVAGQTFHLRPEPAPEPIAVLASAPTPWALWRDGVAGPSGYASFAEPLLLGGAGPVAVAGGMAYVADDVLTTPGGPVEGRFAHVPAALAVVDGELRAFRLSAGQVWPFPRGDAVPAISVLAAAFGERGAAALVHIAAGDRIRGWNAAGRATLDVAAPAPLDDAVRFFPTRLLVAPQAIWVFLDGRVILRLSAP